jgi:hypothetical protein
MLWICRRTGDEGKHRRYSLAADGNVQDDVEALVERLRTDAVDVAGEVH